MVLLGQDLELLHDVGVLGHIACILSELGVVLHEPHHVLDAVDLGAALRLHLVFFNQLLHVVAEFAVVEVHVLSEELVEVGVAHDLFLLSAQLHPVVPDAHQLMDHGLVCPLVEQWRDGIIHPI